MKTVSPRIEDVLRVRFTAQRSYLSRFKRYWGVTTINGIEVLNYKRKYYKKMDDRMVKLTKLLGVYDDLQGKMKGIDSAWLYLNPAKADDSEVNWDKEILVRNLNRAMDKTRKATICVGPKTLKDGLVPPQLSHNLDDSEELKAEVLSKYLSLWRDDYQISANHTDPFVSILQTYLLRSNDIPYTIEYVRNTTVGTVKTDPRNPDHVLSDHVKAVWVYLNYDDFPITLTTDIVDMITSDMADRGDTTSKMLYALSDGASEDFDGSDPYESQAVTVSDFWATPLGSSAISFRYNLKTSFFTSTTLTGEQKVKYLNSCIDSGYRKKKKKAYEVILAIVIIAVAFYFAGPAGAAAATAITTGALAVVLTVAITLTVAAMYIRLAMTATYLLGAENIALSLGTFLKQIAPLLKVAEVISLIAAVYSIVNTGIERATAAAVEEAGDQAAKATIKEITLEIAKLVIETVTGIPLSTDLSTQHMAKMVDMSFGLYTKSQNKDAQKKMENYRKDIAMLEAAREQSKVSDTVKDMMRVYPNPINIDQSVYADRYDRPYEWWATPYHTGNIQATTVNALWLS